jgi:NAD(P)-dependent dehydrogenase (short-subunit alcohol dehydrogenase family)
LSATPAQLLDLSGTVVVVTGASGTIGGGIARRFLAAGASVVAHANGRPLPADLVDRCAVVAVDLTAEDGPERLVEAAVDAFGRLDAVINNAGIQPTSSLAGLADADWRRLLDVNVTAVHRVTQTAAARLAAQGEGGAIVHVASIEGLQPAPLHEHYAVSKAAVIMHARAAAGAYGTAGIRVNSVSPGLVEAEGIEEAWPEGVARWRAAAPLARLGTPAEVGDACVFLCSPLARFITGANLVVDGGVLARPTW